jgi:hypothetical protein
VRWAQAATGRVAAALFGKESLQSHLPGANFRLWRRSRAAGGGPSGKDRLKLYDKGTVLRPECTAYDPGAFKVYRAKEGDPDGPKA